MANNKGKPNWRHYWSKCKANENGPLHSMVDRRLRQAGIATKAGNHMFRASGITIYLENGGQIEHTQQMAAHESPRTTKLYDRRSDVVSLDEIEKIII